MKICLYSLKEYRIISNCWICPVIGDLLLVYSLSLNLNNNPRLQLHRKPIVPNDNLLKPPPGKALVKLGHLRILLLDELGQLVDTLDLFVTDGCVDEVLLFQLTKLVYSYVRFSYPKQYSDIKMTLVTLKKRPII